MATVKKKAVKKKAVKKKTVKAPRIKKNGDKAKANNPVGKKRGTYKATAPKKKKDKRGGNRGNAKLVLSDEQIEVLGKAAGIGCNYHEMAQSVGINQDTLRRCREEQSGVQEAITLGKAKGCIKAKNNLFSIATVAPSKAKQVNLNALVYFMNNNTEFSTQLEVNEGTNIPKDVDVTDDEAVKTYLEMIKKPE